MSEPVTTNPFVIMLINMTVVFIVLISLGLVINLIHAIDPTKEKAAPKKEAPAPAPAPAPAAPAPEPVSADGVSPEVIAVIAAALASYGYGPAAIRAVRPIERDGWKNAGRSFGVQRTLE